jgi:class 3 adenylate cyclase
MTADNYKRKLAAIFSADVHGYSRLMRDDELKTVKTLNAYRDLMKGFIVQHHGRIVDSPGDNILAEFSSVVDAVQAATSIQRELKEQNAGLPPHRKMEFRIGINLGDIIAEGDRIYGNGVNIAARLESIAEPGGICISRTAYDQIEDKLPLGYEYLGEKVVKNLPKPIPAYKVVIDQGSFVQKARRWASGRIKESLAPEDAQTSAPMSQSRPRRHERKVSDLSQRKRLLLLILCAAFGVFGVHRFYTGRTKTAKLMLFTIGGLGIWYVTDLIIIIFGEFVDCEGKRVRQWV